MAMALGVKVVIVTLMLSLTTSYSTDTASPPAGRNGTTLPDPSPKRTPYNKNDNTDSCARIMSEGSATQAKACFERALLHDPKNILAHTYLGMLADAAGNLAAAGREFAAALRTSPNSPSARNNYGVILLRQGKTSEAARQFQASLQLDPSQVSPLVNLAQIDISNGGRPSLQRARNLLLRARAVKPDLEIARSLVLIDANLGDKQAASADYVSYLAESERSGVNAAPGKIRAESVRQRRQLGDALVASGLPTYGISELQAAAAANPSDSESVVRLARAQYRQRQYNEAGRTLESALARGVADGSIYALLAEVYEATGHVENAVPAMRLAIEAEPKSEEYRFRYGMLLADTKAPQAGIIRLQEALKLFPHSPRLWFGLGLAQFQDHKNQAAQQSFEQALRIDPKSIPALTYLGLLALDAARYTEAESFYQRCLDLNPKLGLLHYLMAEALQKQQTPNPQKAEKELIAANSLDPGFAAGRLALGKLYLSTDRKPEAVAQFKEAIYLNPQLAEAHYQLARTYQRLKDVIGAKAEFDVFKTLSADEKNRDEQQRKELLTKLAHVDF